MAEEKSGNARQAPKWCWKKDKRNNIINDSIKEMGILLSMSRSHLFATKQDILGVEV